METKDLLNPQIGIDRSVLYNFTLEDIDTELLKQRAHEIDTLDSPCDKITFLENRSSIVIAPGRNIGKLCIEDRQYGRFEVSYRKNNFTGQQYVFSQIQMINWNERTGNVRSLTASEYKQSVRDMIKHFQEVYGVKINASDIRIKEIELNATFFLEEAFENYAPAITLMMVNLPESRYRDRKFVTWQQVREEKVCLETTVAKNSTSQIKIYNKSKHLKDIGTPLHTEKDIFRLEYTIRDSRILEHTDNMNSPWEISQKSVDNLFGTYFKRDIVTSYKKWRKKNTEELIILMRQCVNQSQKDWINLFLRECLRQERITKIPLLFSLDDVKPIIKKVFTRNTKRKYDSFLNYASKETDLLGNTRRFEEIIMYVQQMLDTSQ